MTKGSAKPNTVADLKTDGGNQDFTNTVIFYGIPNQEPLRYQFQ